MSEKHYMKQGRIVPAPRAGVVSSSGINEDQFQELKDLIVEQTNRIVQAIQSISISVDSSKESQFQTSNSSNVKKSKVSIDDSIVVSKVETKDVEKGFTEIEASTKVEDTSLSKTTSKLKSLKGK